MKPLEHAKRSEKRYGGKWEDYISVHNFLDSSKEVEPTIKHRMMYHHTTGIFLCEKIFGVAIVNSDDKLVSVRSIAEEHILEDLGFIPTIQDWYKLVNITEVMQMRPKPSKTQLTIG